MTLFYSIILILCNVFTLIKKEKQNINRVLLFKIQFYYNDDLYSPRQ